MLLAVILCTSRHLHDVPGDGNCLFSAVALAIALTDNVPAQARARSVRNMAARLRIQALDVLCPSGLPDPDLILGGLPVRLLIEPLDDEGEAGYCRRLRRDGEWGSTAEMLALTHVLGRSIHVHTDFGIEEYGDERHDSAASDQLVPIAVHYDGASRHYQALTGSSKTPSPKGEL